MDKVQRWSPAEFGRGEMTEDDDGDFVELADYDTLRQQLAAALAERERDAKDAARYRWLREGDPWKPVRVPCPCPDAIRGCQTAHTTPMRYDALDAAIDAALAAADAGKGEGA